MNGNEDDDDDGDDGDGVDVDDWMTKQDEWSEDGRSHQHKSERFWLSLQRLEDW